jgi:hypothetical protein
MVKKKKKSSNTKKDSIMFTTSKGYVIDVDNKTISVQGKISMKNIYMDIKQLLSVNSDALEHNIACICKPTQYEGWHMSEEHLDWKIKEITK